MSGSPCVSVPSADGRPHTAAAGRARGRPGRPPRPSAPVGTPPAPYPSGGHHPGAEPQPPGAGKPNTPGRAPARRPPHEMAGGRAPPLPQRVDRRVAEPDHGHGGGAPRVLRHAACLAPPDEPPGTRAEPGQGKQRGRPLVVPPALTPGPAGLCPLAGRCTCG